MKTLYYIQTKNLISTLFQVTKRVYYIAICLMLTMNFISCSSERKKESNESGIQKIDKKATTKKVTKKPKTHIVEIKQMKFVPEDIEVKVGEKITFVNMDMFAHDVTDENDTKWSSSLIESGASWTMIVEQSANYYCKLHVIMKGRINIADEN